MVGALEFPIAGWGVYTRVLRFGVGDAHWGTDRRSYMF